LQVFVASGECIGHLEHDLLSIHFFQIGNGQTDALECLSHLFVAADCAALCALQLGDTRSVPRNGYTSLTMSQK
jgi:hypothetical protein